MSLHTLCGDFLLHMMVVIMRGFVKIRPLTTQFSRPSVLLRSRFVLSQPKIIKKNVEACNGLIQVVDFVLLPGDFP